MTITIQEVERIAKLSRIGIEDSDKQIMKNQLSGILNWIDKLQEVDVSTVSLNEIPQTLMHEREDLITAPNQVQEVLSNAPQTAHNMYAVPKVVE